MRPGERGAQRARRRTEAHRADGRGVARVGIGVVGQNVAGGGRAARTVGNPALLGGIDRVGHRRRRGVRRCRHDDVEGLACREAAEIGGRDLDPSVPISPLAGVPLNVPVAALKLSQTGSDEPSAAVAV